MKILLISAGLLLSASSWVQAGPAAPTDPATIFKETCTVCHEHPETKAPPVENLRKLSRQKIHQTLELGIMQPMAAHLTPEQRSHLATWLAAEEDLKRNEWLTATACPKDTPVELNGEENWGMGGHNLRNPTGVAITAANLHALELQWSVALPAVGAMRSLPVVAGNTVFLGTDGRVLALERHTGCVRWALGIDAVVRNSLTLERTPDGIATLFFADELATVYAVDAAKGTLRWRQSVKIHPTSIISGSIAYHADKDGSRIFIPLSQFEVMVAANPKHECCRAHGGITALDAQTGARVWHYAVTPDARPTTISAAGTQLWGPSGGSVWNRPTVDAGRGLLYFGTGENASSPPTDTSDAIIALELKTGKPRWVFQALPGDAWNLSCNFKGPNCPKEDGPDFDFGASAMLAKRKGGDLLLAGQKSGEIFALNPDTGALVWRHHFTPTAKKFNSNAGIHHGMASDGQVLIVPIADTERPVEGHVPQPGVHAVRVADGKVLWSHRFTRGCAMDPADIPGVSAAEKMGGGSARNPWPACSFYYAPSAPPTLANGLAWVPTLDGKLHVFDALTGKVLRVIETNRAYAGSNGVDGHGGALDVAGVRVAGDQLLVPSGYAMFGQMPGNMLLVYGLKK